MNRRLLLSLYDRSGIGAYMPVDLNGHELEVEEHMEKFAELIVRECMDCAEWVGKVNTTPVEPINTVHTIKKRIKEHFGVKE